MATRPACLPQGSWYLSRSVCSAVRLLARALGRTLGRARSSAVSSSSPLLRRAALQSGREVSCFLAQVFIPVCRAQAVGSRSEPAAISSPQGRSPVENSTRLKSRTALLFHAYFLILFYLCFLKQIHSCPKIKTIQKSIRCPAPSACLYLKCKTSR